ncbi:hypothetical protein FISHEDRAFT_25021, partial [Fistulina hepatica ATCC 64428]
KDDRTLCRRHGRAPKGTTPDIRWDHRRGDRYSILPTLTLDGYIAVRVVKGSITSEELYNFLIEDLIPKLNPFPEPRSVVILDN